MSKMSTKTVNTKSNNKTKQNKPLPKDIVEITSDSDTSDSESDKVIHTTQSVKKQNINNDDIKVSTNSDSESESDEEKEMKAKKRDKKHKESYKELFDKIKENHAKNIETTKHIGVVIEGLTKLFKESKARDKDNEKLLEHLGKSHSDDLLKASNSRPKRGGNSGFKAKELPEYLFTFLKDNDQVTAEETALANPKVLSKLNNIFTNRNLRKGKNIYLDKDTCKDLNLSEDICTEWDLYDEENKVVIKFEKFGKFVSRLINRK
jgi:hypothetical protein